VCRPTTVVLIFCTRVLPAADLKLENWEAILDELNVTDVVLKFVILLGYRSFDAKVDYNINGRNTLGFRSNETYNINRDSGTGGGALRLGLYPMESEWTLPAFKATSHRRFSLDHRRRYDETASGRIPIRLLSMLI
jgi:hypothetical protein